MAIKLCILKNESENSHREWVLACQKYRVDHDVVDLSKNGWFEAALQCEYDAYLTRPPGSISFFKTLYDERLYILTRVLGKKIYPTYEEILIYENKKFFSYWLAANGIPHPKTRVFYHREEALGFAATCRFPVVAKSAIGASGSGVRIFRSKPELKRYINGAFSPAGIKRSYGPNLRKNNKVERFLNVLKDPGVYWKKIQSRRTAADIDPQRWFVILQEHIPVEYEWRAVKIGDSYFAHKKLPVKGMCSGTTMVSWDGPGEELLDFVEATCARRGFYSQAVDIFEDRSGKFLVNEMQAFFGSENPHQMIIDGRPGRYVRRQRKWHFEAGEFNTNNSYDLRLEHLMQILENQSL